jgi:hypothetical protein
VIVLRVAGLFFAFAEIVLALRLVLPFVEVPVALEDYVPTLVAVSDWFVQPFRAIIEPYDLEGVLADFGQLTEVALGPYADSIDPAVIVAMVGWAIISSFVLFVLRLIVRPGR